MNDGYQTLRVHVTKLNTSTYSQSALFNFHKEQVGLRYLQSGYDIRNPAPPHPKTFGTNLTRIAMKVRVLTVLALGAVLGISTGVYGQALRREGTSSAFSDFSTIAANRMLVVGSSTVSNTTSVSNSPGSVFVQDTVTVTRSVIVAPSQPPKTSPGQTSTVAQSITTANPPTSTKPSATPNPFRTCWATGECKRLLIEFTMTYNESGKITDPNEHDPKGFDQSHKFRRQLCSVRQYEKLVAIHLTLLTQANDEAQRRNREAS